MRMYICINSNGSGVNSPFPFKPICPRSAKDEDFTHHAAAVDMRSGFKTIASLFIFFSLQLHLFLCQTSCKLFVSFVGISVDAPAGEEGALKRHLRFRRHIDKETSHTYRLHRLGQAHPQAQELMRQAPVLKTNVPRVLLQTDRATFQRMLDPEPPSLESHGKLKC